MVRKADASDLSAEDSASLPDRLEIDRKAATYKTAVRLFLLVDGLILRGVTPNQAAKTASLVMTGYQPIRAQAPKDGDYEAEDREEKGRRRRGDESV